MDVNALFWYSVIAGGIATALLFVLGKLTKKWMAVGATVGSVILGLLVIVLGGDQLITIITAGNLAADISMILTKIICSVGWIATAILVGLLLPKV
jgi:hypothetical protein